MKTETPNTDDITIIRRLFQNNKQSITGSLTEFTKHFEPMIETLIHRSVTDRDTVKNIVQEVWIKLFEAIRKTKTVSANRFDIWLASITMDETENFLKAQDNEKSKFKQYIEDCKSKSLKSMESNPENQAIYNEILDQIHQSIWLLAPNDQVIVTLSLYTEMNTPEIAKEAGVTEKICKSVLSNFKRKMMSKVTHSK